MRRYVLVLIALFGFAAVGAASANDAFTLAAGASMTTAFCAEPGHVHAVKFKPCGKLRNGIALPCHADIGLLPAPGSTPFIAPQSHEAAIETPAFPQKPADRLFRPPRLFA